MKTLLTVVATLTACAPLLAQHPPASAGTDLPAAARPSAISGMASSARHCVSGDGANVHGLGWLEAGAGYTVTFDSNVSLLTAVSQMDLAGQRATASYGSPELRFTASTPGTMALHVAANGQGGCYRYKVEITSPARSSAPAAAGATTGVLKPAKAAGPAAISGFASSAKHCIAGDYVANVHEIGGINEGNQVTITFASDFDAVAGVTFMNLQTRRAAFVADDDSGGNLEPRLFFIASYPSTLVLYVSGARGSAGCYRYKVEIR